MTRLGPSVAKIDRCLAPPSGRRRLLPAGSSASCERPTRVTDMDRPTRSTA